MTTTLPAVRTPDPESLTDVERRLAVVDILGRDLQVGDVIVLLAESYRVEYLGAYSGTFVADGTWPAGTRVAYADGGRWGMTVPPDVYIRCLPRP